MKQQQCQCRRQFVLDVYLTQSRDHCWHTDVALHPEHACYVGSVINSFKKINGTIILYESVDGVSSLLGLST